MARPGLPDFYSSPELERPYTIPQMYQMAAQGLGGNQVRQVVEGLERFAAINPNLVRALATNGVRVAFTASLPAGAGAIYYPGLKLLGLPADISTFRETYDSVLRPTFGVSPGAYLTIAELAHAVDDVAQPDLPRAGVTLRTETDPVAHRLGAAYRWYAQDHLLRAGDDPNRPEDVAKHFQHGLLDPSGPHLLGTQGIGDVPELFMEASNWVVSDPTARARIQRRFPDLAGYVESRLRG
ncbi:MAG: hypothetical protein AB1758_16370 [Candidatus Eremiobacterota bacterium]